MSTCCSSEKSKEPCCDACASAPVREETLYRRFAVGIPGIENYVGVADRVYVASRPNVSDPFEIGDANAFQIEATAFAFVGGGAAQVTYEFGNDAENFRPSNDILPNLSFTAAGFKTVRITPVPYRYARFRYAGTVASTRAILAIGVHLCRL
jgi:hypothetical protein